MEEKEKESEFKEETDFKEEIIILDRPVLLRGPSRKLNSKIIGKKTILGKVRLKSKTKLIKPKKSNAEFLIDSIVKSYWTSKWKNQIIIMKYSRIGYNKKRGDFRSLCMKLNHSMKYHQYLYLTKLFDKMEKLPMKEGIKHDEYYGKLKLVSNNINKKDKVEENNIKNKNGNIIYDDIGKIEIKIDIPKIVEVEFKPEDELMIQKEKINENNNNQIIEGKIEIEKEPIPKLINLKNDKKIIEQKDNIENNNKKNDDKENIELINIDNSNKGINININENGKINKIEIKEEIIEPIKVEQKEENNKNENVLLNQILINKIDFKGNYNNENIDNYYINKNEDEENSKVENNNIIKENFKNLIQGQNLVQKIIEVKVEKDEDIPNKGKILEEHIEIIENKPLKEKEKIIIYENTENRGTKKEVIKTEIDFFKEGIKDKNGDNITLKVKKDGYNLSKKIKRIKDNYLGINDEKDISDKKRKSLDIDIKYNGIEIEEEENEKKENKENKKRKMSDFYN